MYLLIDPTDNKKISLTLFDEKDLETKEYEGRVKDLLVSIDAFFGEQNFDKEDLQGILVVVGEGSFTGTRIACVVANTFGYVLQIPLLAVLKKDFTKAQDLVSKISKQKSGVYISATYSGEPNIGKKK